MRIGTIGTGFIVDAIIEAAKLDKSISFTAVYSRSTETGTKFADKYNIKHVFDDMEAFLNSDTFDVVYIASPNSLHYSQTMQALDLGKHVIVEKPFAGNVEQAKEMIKKAKEKKLFLFEAITNIYLPHFDYLKNELSKIGNIKLIQMNMSQVSSRYHALMEGKVTNVFDPNFYGGCLMDLNIYNIHLMTGLFGLPQEVSYVANLFNNGVDISGELTLKYPNFVGSLVASKDSLGQNFVQIQGDAGYIYIPSSASMLTEVKTYTKDSKSIYDVQTMPTHYYEFKSFQEMMDQEDYNNCYKILNHSLEVVEIASAGLEQIGLKYE